ncbi:MAG: sigma-54-dependent transcriptional regulator [Bacteroidales bacterium]
MSERLNILIVDDEADIRHELEEMLQVLYGCSVFKASNREEALNVLRAQSVDIVFLDIRMPGTDGLSVLGEIKDNWPDLEVIMISGHGAMDSVIQAMRNKAVDFLPKPFSSSDIRAAIERTQRYKEMKQKIANLEASLSLLTLGIQKKLGQGFIAESKAMKEVAEMVRKVAQSDTTSVLIIGESGTGKELIARSIHFLSPRRDKYFYAVNSSAITETLFESEFFGHTKGSFTGANENKTGWFEVANHGTLFLDEIGDLPLGLQTKFLRVLEEKKISRVGATREIDIDVRIIAATNQDLEKLTEEKRFRLDLYHRLSTFIIHVPPLRERKEDIPLLLNYFAEEFARKLNKKIKGVELKAIEHLMQYSFPGNVRELRNMVERAVILCEKDRLRLSDFQLGRAAQRISKVASEIETLDLEELEKNAIMKAIKLANYNKSAAARLLNISFQALDRRIKKYNLSFDQKLI